jgi:hypothetical protein
VRTQQMTKYILGGVLPVGLTFFCASSNAQAKEKRMNEALIMNGDGAQRNLGSFSLRTIDDGPIARGDERRKLERETGIEPRPTAREAATLLLSYSRSLILQDVSVRRKGLDAKTFGKQHPVQESTCRPMRLSTSGQQYGAHQNDRG